MDVAKVIAEMTKGFIRFFSEIVQNPPLRSKSWISLPTHTTYLEGNDENKR